MNHATLSSSNAPSDRPARLTRHIWWLVSSLLLTNACGGVMGTGFAGAPTLPGASENDIRDVMSPESSPRAPSTRPEVLARSRPSSSCSGADRAVDTEAGPSCLP
jgi:hypothetical protein